MRSRNRKLGRGTRTGEAEPGELVAKQPLRIQYLDRAVAFGAFDNAIQEMRIDGARSGIILLEVIRREGPEGHRSGRRQIRRRPHHRSRSPARLVERRVREIEQAPQADDRQHRAAQVGKAQEASRRQRHVGEPGTRTISLTCVEPKPSESSAIRKTTKCSSLGTFGDCGRAWRVSARDASTFGRAARWFA